MKRSRAVRLALMGSASAALALPLAACDEPKQEVGVYPSAEACTRDGVYSADECRTAFDAAATANAEAAPRFASKELCEDEFGDGRCEADSYHGGGYFMPFMLGYMMGGFGRSGVAPQPVYRSRSAGGAIVTSRGESVGTGFGRQTVRAAATAAPQRTTSVVTSKGGFGTRARFGGG
ncbi:MAG: DUF1190 domain-containing protein [Geminicoccaceae bacterium]|nr:DUF1190 domain-containing protein [Geminicoccaceae bacterium]